MNKTVYLEKNGWNVFNLGEFLQQVQRKIPRPNKPYGALGIRSHGKGTFHKVIKRPETILMDTLYQVKESDLIVNITFAWEGAIAIVRKEDEDYLVSHRFPTYSFNTTIALSQYLKYYINQKGFFDKLGYISPGGAGRNRVLNKKDFLKIQILLPPLPEQKKIAEILTSVDNTIESTRKVLKQTKRVKQGLLQKLLAKGIGHTKFKKTVIGEVPEEWEVVKIVDCIDIISGQVDPKSEPFCNYILIAPNHIESGTGRILNKETAKEQNAISGKYLFKDNDVIYSKIRPYLKKAFLSNFDGLCSADMYALRAGSSILSRYLLAVVLSEFFTEFAKAKSMRTGIPKLNRKELGEFFCPLPSIAEQKKIVNILLSIDDELEATEQELSQLQQLKKGLMQDLLSGTVRVKI